MEQTVKISDVVKSMNITLTVIGLKAYRFRLRLAKLLIRSAGKLGRFKVKWEQ